MSKIDMWGDPERAASLDSSDALASLLLQISGPGHVAWNDPRWQELLHGYEVLVHLEHTRLPNKVVTTACATMARHAATSSNLAALCLHLARMLRDLEGSLHNETPKDFTHKIALVGKARATAGVLNLVRILVHDVKDLGEALIYRSRDMAERHSGDQMAGYDLVSSLLGYLASTTHKLEVPELYDATVMSLELLLVLLSTQLYQPLVSSAQRVHSKSYQNPVLDFIVDDARRRRKHPTASDSQDGSSYSPRSLLQALLGWQIRRPRAPKRSIAYHTAELAESVADAKGDKVGPDGMYETHVIVMAETVANHHHHHSEDANNSSHPIPTTRPLRRSSSKVIFDVSRGVLVLSSSLILLPFRLMSLALELLSRGRKGPGYDQLRKDQLKSKTGESRRINEVLWLTDSPIADLATSLLLLLTHNNRVGNNPFRTELGALNDNRWEETQIPEVAGPSPSPSKQNEPLLAVSPNPKQLMTNFETMFESFGSTVHTELGALMLYTMYQSSPIFAQSIAVRSDLDTLIVPLLRTLYFSSSLKHYSANVNAAAKAENGSGNALSPRNCPFRSPSQLYVILILLLLFSQDASFAPDAFRRVFVPSVPWYKERHLKDVTLGSLLLLSLLRSITFNLNRLQDAFLLSNCCAVLMNLSPSVSHLHEYAAMRLAAVTISSLKKYALMVERNGGKEDDGEDLTTALGMYGEVSRTLVGLLRHCLSPKNVEKNLQLVYALVYHQSEFKTVLAKDNLKQQKAELKRIELVMVTADKIITTHGNARTAAKALKVLEEHMDQLTEAVKGEKNLEADFTFSYEEEADPEIFFLPYIWDVIVCCVTSSTLEWDVGRISVFPLLDEEEDDFGGSQDGPAQTEMISFTADVKDIV